MSPAKIKKTNHSFYKKKRVEDSGRKQIDEHTDQIGEEGPGGQFMHVMRERR